jgi:hypothetical protein
MDSRSFEIHDDLDLVGAGMPNAVADEFREDEGDVVEA